eukprot:TRINITY_DN1523_c1_g1_i1.p1 TRINITY_DN1523_c1_g1~~TRINITY_DN1523_c1_g1_i1.p1  ORF type:complete len:483 (-),score=63.97 TRINITY_DN1523_c1_g1_i1:254-1702(-)
MGSSVVEKPHAVCIPYPAQGHITPMLKLAKLLHFRGFHITFVNTQFNHNRLLRSTGHDSLKGLDDFRFETIPDGLRPSDQDSTQDIPSLCDSTSKNCLVPFRSLVAKLNNSVSSNTPRVSYIVSDGAMSFTLAVAEELGIPEVLFWTTSACGFMGYLHYREVIERGLSPFKDVGYLHNEYLDTRIDWIPGMKNIRLRDLPSFLRTTNPNDIMLNFANNEAQRASKASAIILNTFDALEHEVINAMKSILPQVYTIGPLSMLCRAMPNNQLASIESNLWKEETECLEWLDQKKPNSVIYVNFGSIAVLTTQQLKEFAWGLANSKHLFLWVIRRDLVKGELGILSEEFIKVAEERGLLSGWCPQEQVLAHPSIGGFLTHNGWNSTLESICEGVPMICWPFFAEQQTNCRYACTEWAIGMEIDSDVKREEIEGLVKELMEGEKGKEMRNKAIKWKESAVEATKKGGSSHVNMEKLASEVLSSVKK